MYVTGADQPVGSWVTSFPKDKRYLNSREEADIVTFPRVAGEKAQLVGFSETEGTSSHMLKGLLRKHHIPSPLGVKLGILRI